MKKIISSLSLMLITSFLVTPSFAKESLKKEAFTQRDLNEQGVMGIVWYQQSGEFRGLCYQAFNMAKLSLDKNLAAVKDSKKKKAIICDLDEALIDNSPFQAGLVDKDFGYSSAIWKEWCEAEKTEALPGAADFLNYVVQKGVEVFYISNRKVNVLEPTMRNLKKIGFPMVDKKHVLLKEKTSNKEPRRESVTADHEVLLLVGDNLNDFDKLFGKETSAQERMAKADKVKDLFGHKFIILPNPHYGDFEAAVYGGGKWYKKSAQERSEIRKANMKKFEFKK